MLYTEGKVLKMSRKTVVLFAIVCFSIVICTVQALSPIRGSNRTTARPPRHDRRSLQGLTEEQRHEAFKQNAEALRQMFIDIREPRRRAGEERAMRVAREANKRELGVSDRELDLILSKVKKVTSLRSDSWKGALCKVDMTKQVFHWCKYTEGMSFFPAIAPHELSEGHRLVDDLIDLLRDENSTDQEIRKTIDALQQFRKRAREKFPKAQRELAAVLITPRQEAIGLIAGLID